MIKNNLIALVSNIAINFLVFVSAIGIYFMMVFILPPESRHEVSSLICFPLSLIGALLFVFIGSKLENQGSKWKNFFSVVSVAITSLLIWYYFYNLSFSPDPYDREIDGDFMVYNYFLAPIIEFITTRYPCDCTNSSVVLNQIWTCCIASPLLWLGLVNKNKINSLLHKLKKQHSVTS